MKLSGTQVLGIIKEYFSGNQSSATETFWYLLLPGIIFTIILLLYTLWPEKNRGFDANDDEEPDFNSDSGDNEEDFDLIDSIRLQKGLETSERDYLFNVCQDNKLDIIKVMLDKSMLDKLESRVTEKIVFSGNNPENDKTIIFLRKLKKKLFF